MYASCKASKWQLNVLVMYCMVIAVVWNVVFHITRPLSCPADFVSLYSIFHIGWTLDNIKNFLVHMPPIVNSPGGNFNNSY